MKTRTKDIFMYSLAAIIVIGIFTIISFLIFKVMPLENKDLLTLTLGALIAGFSNVLGYFFGSSKGSADKNEMLSNSTPNNPPQV